MASTMRAATQETLFVQALDRKLADSSGRDEIPHQAEVSREITAPRPSGSSRDGARHVWPERRRTSELRCSRSIRAVRAAVERRQDERRVQRALDGDQARSGDIRAEDEILAEMERREGIEARIVEIDAELELKRAAAADRLAELEQELGFVQREMAALDQRRQGMVSEVEPGLYRLYDRLRRGRRFPALVPLKGHACGACHSRLPAGHREIAHHGSLHPCEACGVLIYAPIGVEADA
jgi:predicted  nucleic acid-binding Zn-ribbon protein